jgi:GMP synthase-like glutamine amidotransferase
VQALVIGNADDLDTGLVGAALRRRGWHLVERTREAHGEWPRRAALHDLEGTDLVVSLGSSWSTYWERVADAVRAEQTLMREAIDAGCGILGICFGAQQLATVLGGSVARAPQPEIGWHRVEAGIGASGTPGSEVLVGEWLQWHYDAVTLPEGIEPLAVSPVGPQAFTAGRCVGVQFHPEATEAVIRTWSEGEGAVELSAVGLDAQALAEDTARRMAEMEARTDRLVEWVLTEIGA